jgi:hypothetical protein
MRCPGRWNPIVHIVEPLRAVRGDASLREALSKSTGNGVADSSELAAAMGANRLEALQEALSTPGFRPPPLLPPLLCRFSPAERFFSTIGRICFKHDILIDH